MSRLSDLYQSIPFGSKLGPESLAKARKLYRQSEPGEQRSAFHAFGRKGIAIALVAPPPVAAEFVLGEDVEPLVVPGFDSGKRWNGWAAPLVEFPALLALVEWLRSCGGMSQTFVVNVGKSTLEVSEDGETFTVEGESTACDDGVDRLLFDVSLGFTWEIKS